jgi:hypothetical protein
MAKEWSTHRNFLLVFSLKKISVFKDSKYSFGNWEFRELRINAAVEFFPKENVLHIYIVF